MGSPEGPLHDLRPGSASAEDKNRLLSGHEPTWRLSAPGIRLSRLPIPAAEGDLALVSIRRLIPARSQSDIAEGDPADDPEMGTPSPERPGPGQSGSNVQPVHSRLDQLLWPLLQVGSFLDAAPDRCLLTSLGA